MTVDKYCSKHAGERAFLVGNGPSLEHTPLHLLEDEFSIAMNKIGDVFETTDWRPSYYLQVNPTPYSHERIERILDMNARGITCFVNQDVKDEISGRVVNDEHIEFLNVQHLSYGEQPVDKAKSGEYSSFWSKDINDTVYLTVTSMYVAAQVASYMGFDELYFLGCDLYPEFQPLPYVLLNNGSDPTEFTKLSKDIGDYLEFITNNGAPLSSIMNGVWYKFIYQTSVIDMIYSVYNLLGKVEKTHFTKGQTNRLYDAATNVRLSNNHQMIKSIGEWEGFKCYNATEGGRLEVYDRVDLRDVV